MEPVDMHECFVWLPAVRGLIIASLWWIFADGCRDAQGSLVPRTLVHSAARCLEDLAEEG